MTSTTCLKISYHQAKGHVYHSPHVMHQVASEGHQSTGGWRDTAPIEPSEEVRCSAGFVFRWQAIDTVYVCLFVCSLSETDATLFFFRKTPRRQAGFLSLFLQKLHWHLNEWILFDMQVTESLNEAVHCTVITLSVQGKTQALYQALWAENG